ncbi:MAG TPA: KH domain-containing protein [Acidobacteriaceae bacterium]
MTESLEPSLQKDAVSAMQALILELAKALVDDIAAVRVEVFNENDSSVLRLYVAQSDIGKVIGKQGRTARSLRTILSAASMKYQQRFALDIVEAGERGGYHHHE